MNHYRHPDETDLPQLEEWIAADPDHQDKSTSKFWIPEKHADGNLVKGIQCIAVSDDKGPVFYLKFTNAVLIDTQFAPLMDTDEDKERVRAGIKQAFKDFTPGLKNMGFHSMLFDSVSRSLIRFMEKLGFQRRSDFFKVNI